MADLLKGVEVLKQDLSKVNGEEALKNKVVALYFSAGWCPPCKQFTPKLKKFYETIKAAGKPFEIVFVSRDRAGADLIENFQEKHGDWLALEYGDERIQSWNHKFDIRTIPVLRVVKPDGSMVVPDGRADINDNQVDGYKSRYIRDRCADKSKTDPFGVYDKWQKACGLG